MLPYVFMLGIPIIYYTLFEMPKNKINIDGKRSKTVAIFFFILFLLLSLRNIDVGIDLKNYKIVFDQVNKFGYNMIIGNETEIGYKTLNFIVSRFTDDFQIYLTVTAVLSIVPLYYLYGGEKNNPVLLLVLFVNIGFFSMLFSGLRQSIAVSFFGVIAYHFVKQKKLIKFLIVVSAAAFFHASAIFLFLLYPIYHARFRPKHMIYVVPIMALIFIFNNHIFSLLFVIFGAGYRDKYMVISESASYTMMILFILFSVFSFVIPSEESLDEDTIGLRNILLLCTFIQLFAPINTVVMRMNYYFIIYIPLLIPRIIRYSKVKWSMVAELANVIMVVFFLFYYFYYASTSADIMQVYPYKPFWE